MSAGRKRTFDEGCALRAAMETFWQNGYSGTTLQQLTSAMGINRPSLYNAYGNKEALFIASLHLYVQETGESQLVHLQKAGGDTRAKVRAYLKSIAENASDATLPGGCFVTNTTLEMEGSSLPEGVKTEIAHINETARSTLVEFFTQEADEQTGEAQAAPDLQADLLLLYQYGIAVMARNGADQQRLARVIDRAILSF